MMRRDGFTLLEVLLTLAMSVVLMLIIGNALSFYASDLNVRNLEVRQVQVASAVLQMIEDDLRATLHGEPIDTAALASMLESLGSDAGGGGAVPDEDEDLSAAGIEGTEADTEAPPADLTTGSAALQSPGLIGNQSQIQVDVSRLPRLEEYIVMLDGTTSDIEDIPSDLKTVTYYVQSSGMTGGVADPLTQPDTATAGLGAAPGGLVRRSLDRFATVYAVDTGVQMTLNQTGELLAPEVVAIEFSYWDGSIWQLQWNSDEMGELPQAVQVQIAVVDSAETAASMSDPGSLATNPVQPRLFTHVIRLPLARPIDTSIDTTTGAAL